MTDRRELFEALAAVAGLAVAPVPSPTEAQRVRRLYGTPDEAAARCSFQLRGTELIVRTPGAWRPNGYRIGRSVAGDFDARVKLVSLDSAPRVPGLPPGELVTEAGLFVAAAGRSVAVYRRLGLQLGDADTPDRLDDSVWVWQGYGTREADGAGGAVYLGVARRGRTVSVTWGRDGKEWAGPVLADGVELPDEVTVGLFVGHRSDHACEGRFDQLTLTQPKN